MSFRMTHELGLQILFGPKYWLWYYDETKLFYITPHYLSKQMTKYADLLYQDILNRKANDPPLLIWDMFSGIGTDAIYFSRYFNVIASELDKKTYQIFQKNIKSFNLSNINALNVNCISIASQINPDVIYYDPPWGETYRSKNKNFDFSQVFIDYPNNDDERFGNLPKKVSCTDLAKFLFRNVCKNIIIKSPMNSNSFDRIFNYNIVYTYKYKNKNLKFLFISGNELNQNLI